MSRIISRSNLLLSAAGELFLWLMPCSAFLYLYVGTFNNPSRAILPHLTLVCALLLGSVGARAMLPAREERATYLASSLVLLPWTLLMSWYAIALVGLYSWGRLTTWPIFITYAKQAPYLLSSLGYPSWIVWLPLGALLFTVFVVGHFDLLKARWPRLLFNAGGDKQRLTLASLLAALPIVLASMIGMTVGTSPFEPIQISLLKSGSPLMQHHEFSASPATNQAERDAQSTYTTARSIPARNLILIIGDALRADHMGVYGYARDTTPYLSGLARRPQTYVMPRVRATCAESLCGLMSLAASRPLHAMPSRPFTLQQVVKTHGYAVHMILSGDHTNFYGLREFYGTVDSYTDGSDQQVRWGEENEYRYVNDDNLVLDRVAALPDHEANRPVMLQIALMSSHGLGLRLEQSQRFLPAYNYYSWFSRSNGPTRISEGDRHGAVNFYDNGVAQLDSFVETILGKLQQKGYLDNALVVITGDHGELLGEHGYFAHAVTVHEPVLNIPLIFARFGYDDRELRRAPLAAQIDIAPTVLQELGMPIPDTWAGVPLQASPISEEGRRIYFQQTTEAGLYDVRSDGRLIKYWRDYEDDSEHVFDVVSDPDEKENLLTTVPQHELDDWRRSVVHGGLQRQKADLPNNRVIDIDDLDGKRADISDANLRGMHATP